MRLKGVGHMTATREAPTLVPDFGDEVQRKICFICSKGNLDMAYPALIMANGALTEGVEVDIFFTFWGLDMINQDTVDKLQFTMLGNTAMHMPGSSAHLPQGLAGLPGMTAFSTRMLKKQIAAQQVPDVREFITLLHDMGARLWACKMSADMGGLEKDDLLDEVEGIINVNEFIELSEDAQVIFI
jgi:peroxiredoxin family protein